MIATRLIRVISTEQWNAFHHIRRKVLFEARGLFGVYDDNHPDDREPQNHALLLLEHGRPCGTARLDCLGQGRAIVRLVAVDTEEQGRGLGRGMMGLLEAYAQALGVKELEVNAARDAVSFYSRLGWTLVDAERESPLLRKAISTATES